ncbi:hypothetical protein [Sulfurisphaera tokodaii]|uniref:Uncharacterized protein n=1 Tax=Sulfurisphaera tokodaii TaxID=111955 RepID=A0A832THY5_9CREN|nr:hypothetical protein [Sulfurisphaera tokodaii]HII73178.1 hypothetical protein [Sulfurisphaera tokodaii]
MIHIWLINITIAMISIVIAGLIAFELFQVRKYSKTRLTIALSFLGSILVLEELVIFSAFMMWSSYDNPMYAYPSMAIATLSLLGLIILYYILRI